MTIYYPDLSVCIVTYNTKEYLRQCLLSIQAQTQHSYEIIIVDNHSNDGTIKMLVEDFAVGTTQKERLPAIQLIQNQKNLGYTLPMNQALRKAKGRYLLQLNPDTIIVEYTLDRLVDFLDEYPQVGICGPKVLNEDGSLQKPCRRGESRPWAVISYFSGLAKRFPQNPFFSEYTMGYKDENEIHPVAGVAGSCMLIRREVVDLIGYLDETFFAYQEDADYCFRASKAGWLIYYYPLARIIHYGGKGGSAVEPLQSIYQWHRSYFLFYRKNYARDYFFLFNWLYYLAMFVKLLFSVTRNFFSRRPFGGKRKPG